MMDCGRYVADRRIGHLMSRIDTHQHHIPPDYRKAVDRSGIGAAAGRDMPDWTPEAALETMAALDIATAILSVSVPGTAFLPQPADAAALARDVNDYSADLVARTPDKFGFFATVPLPHVDHAVAEAVRALDELHSDGVVLLANNGGQYLGEDGQHELFAALDARSAVAFIHPATLPGPAIPGIPLLPWTSCSTPRGRRTSWFATASAPATRTFGSS
jgi:predicted TIM-barrel fold metal-dependent hydrolase